MTAPLLMNDTLTAAVAYVHKAMGPAQPKIALMLGSGLGSIADRMLAEVIRIPYQEIPGFPLSTAPGHAGCLLLGRFAGVPVLCFQGRFHYYEGHSPEALAFPIRVLKPLGIETLILTNAAGGVRADFLPGDFMLISDHLNWMGFNPLRGPHDPAQGLRFPDMTEAYDGELRGIAKSVAEAQGLLLHEGVYLAVAGPNFETPAEIRAFRGLGADAVGMSTVPECLVARQIGLRVLGLSCISNMAAGMSRKKLTQEEVEETAQRVRGAFGRLLEGIVGVIGCEPSP